MYTPTIADLDNVNDTLTTLADEAGFAGPNRDDTLDNLTHLVAATLYQGAPVPDASHAAALADLLARLDLLTLANGDGVLSIHLAQVRAAYPSIPAPVDYANAEASDPRFAH